MTREEVVEELQYIHDGLVACELSYEALEIAIKTLSANVPPVVKGEWIEDGYYDLPCVCSNCGHPESIKAKFLYKYCPNCGAYMEFKEEIKILNSDDPRIHKLCVSTMEQIRSKYNERREHEGKRCRADHPAAESGPEACKTDLSSSAAGP